MKWMQKHKALSEWIMMAVGTLLMALAIQYLYDPMGLVTGGFSGLSIILKDLNPHFPLWLTTLVLNVPLFLVAWKMKGWAYVNHSLAATLMLSGWLYVLPAAITPESDIVLSALFGGVVSGVGIGLVFLAEATTGGTDLLAAIIQKFIPYYSLAQIMQVLDVLIVMVGAYIFGLRAALYAIVAIYLTAKISDSMLSGVKFAKLLYVISDRSDEIAQEILTEMDRGVTGLEGTGMYTGNRRNILMCVVSKKELVQIKELIYRIDPGAFVILSDAKEVLGEGFVEHNQ